GGYYVSGQNVEPIDLLGNRYLNLHECQVSNGRDSVTYNVTTPNWIGVGTNASNSADTTPACENNLPGGYVIQGQTVQALDLLDTARGQGFIEFAFTSEIPDPPACEQTITEPAVTSTRQGVLNGTGTGTPT